jgi:hypothetical protein
MRCSLRSRNSGLFAARSKPLEPARVKKMHDRCASRWTGRSFSTVLLRGVSRKPSARTGSCWTLSAAGGPWRLGKLFVAHGDHRIDPHGALGGDVPR